MKRAFLASKTMAVLFLALVPFGAIQAQTCNPDLRLTTPDDVFVDKGDGTVIHRTTNLMWTNCLLGQSGSDCTNGIAQTYTWQQALNAAQNAAVADYNDWRLPNIKELASLVELACYDPAINLNLFPNTPPDSIVWTSSPNTHSTGGSVWVLVFPDGNVTVDGVNGTHHVRLVRVAQ